MSGACLVLDRGMSVVIVLKSVAATTFSLEKVCETLIYSLKKV